MEGDKKVPGPVNPGARGRVKEVLQIKIEGNERVVAKTNQQFQISTEKPKNKIEEKAKNKLGGVLSSETAKKNLGVLSAATKAENKLGGVSSSEKAKDKLGGVSSSDKSTMGSSANVPSDLRHRLNQMSLSKRPTFQPKDLEEKTSQSFHRPHIFTERRFPG